MKKRILAFIMSFCMMTTVLSPAAGTIAAEDLSAVSSVSETLPEETAAEAPAESKASVQSEEATEAVTEAKTESTEAKTEASESQAADTEAESAGNTEASDNTESSESTETPDSTDNGASTETPDSSEATETPDGTEESTDATETPDTKTESTEAQTGAAESDTEKTTEAEKSTESSEKDETAKKELAVSLKTSAKYAFANTDSVELTVKISGGTAPYTVILKEDGNEIQRMENIEKAGKQTLTYSPTEFGEHTLKVIVKDSNDGKVTASADIAVAVNETENEAEWKETFKDVKLTGDWRKDLVEIAKTQIGYEESDRNYIIDEDGKKQGYTRYGAWYGSAYEEWCAMFISFCLNYAGIKAEDFPREAECIRWMNALDELNAFEADTEEYIPVRGDLIFFNVDDAKENPSHVGIVEKVSKKEGKVYTIEGNSAKQVRRKEYGLTDSHIAGYGSIEALMERAEILEQFQTELPIIPEGGIVGTINTENVNMREGAGTEYPIVLIIEAVGTEVTVLAAEEIDGDIWYQVACEETTGYIRSDFLDVEIPETEKAAEIEVVEEISEEVTVTATELSSSEAVIDEGGEIIVYTDDSVDAEDAPLYDSETSYALSMNEAGSEGEQSVMLSQYGKVILSVNQTPCQWQVEVAGQWINMAGETGSTLDVTFAKVVSLFNANGYAKIRCVSEDGQSVSDTVSVYMSYEAVSIPEMEEDLETASAGTYSLTRSAAVATLAEEETETEQDPETVFVEIAYQYENGNEVATSYLAQIEKGGDLITSVIDLPVIQGYVAKAVTPEDAGVTFVAPTSTTNGTIQLKLSDVNEYTKYIVWYVPTFVDFKVEHYLMGFDSKTETAVKQEADTQIISNTKKTGDAVGEGLAKSYTGFKDLWYDDTTEVAADGSTVIKIYYERNYYLMLFDLDEGYGVEPIYAMYGDTVSVGTPTKAGYTFAGWSLDGTTVVELPETMPAENRTYKAVWVQDELAKVNVVFWGENANDEGYSYLETSAIYVKPGQTVTYDTANRVCGYTKEHTHTEDCYDCGLTEHVHSEECCTLAEHTHSGEECCLITEHTHGANCCTVEEHTHNKENGCYGTEVGSAFSLSSSESYVKGTEANGSIGESYLWYFFGESATGNKYIYINGTWYKYTGTASVGTTVSASCGEVAHTHGDGNCKYCKDNLEEHTHNGNNCDYSECTQTVHTHGDGNCKYCDLKVHVHVPACMKCTETEHTHTDDCWITAPGLSNTLWTYVKSDTVTVAADGSTVMNVYFDRVTYTVNFYSNQNCTNEYTALRITAKWGENILSKWPTYNGSSSWYVEGDNNTWQNSIQIMPVGGAKFWGPKTGNSSYKAYYYVEALSGATDTIEYNGVTYILHHTDTSSSSGNVTDEDKYAMEGFTYKEGTSNGSSYSNAKFYYTRHKYAIEFYNPTTLLKKTTGVPYQTPLSSYNWTPEASDAPAQYEPGSVEFVGWYLNPECTGAEYDFTSHTMPAGANDGDTTLVLYAKWQLVERKVRVYPTYESIGDAEQQIGETITVIHGDYIPEDMYPETPVHPTYKNYTFDGWFYQVTNSDGTVTEKAFDFATMPITRDIDVYAKWSTSTPVSFTIYYQLADASGNLLTNDGNYIDVADSLSSKALDGTSITLEAKSGNDLYKEYRTGYFPLTPSHSLTIDITKDVNSYTFKYVEVEKVPYRVVYLIDDGNGSYTVYSEKTVEDNTNVVVTENYLRIPGYMPDAYQKRLIVTANGTTEDDGNNKTDADLGENIIFFYYHKDTENAYYTVSHYIEPIGGVTDEKPWQQYGVTETQTGKIDTVYPATTKTIPGFTFSEAYVDLYTLEDSETVKTTSGPIEDSTAIEAALPDGGMDFRLYYVRNKYPYKVQYLEYGTTNEVAPAETRKAAYYQETVSETTDLEVQGFELVSGVTQYLTIEIDGDGTEENPITKNIITFYYKRSEVQIDYVGVGPDGNLIDTEAEKTAIGSVSPESETVIALGVNSEGTTVAPAGSTAAAVTPTYKFVGWYLDAACTQPVENGWVSDSKITPQKTGNLYVSATYYAKFEYNLTSMTITKSGLNAGDTAIFKVNGEGKTWIVSITGNGSVKLDGLTVGQTYTVTESTDWSWRYTVNTTSQSIVLQPDPDNSGVNTVAFINTPKDGPWLDDEECTVTNKFDDETNGGGQE